MKKSRSMFKILLILVLFASCAKGRVISQLTDKSWGVQEVEYNDSLYGLFFFANNIMSFKEDGSCKLPYFKYTFGLESSWKIVEVKDEKFKLTLFDSDGDFLDDTYIGEIKDTLHYKIMTLKSEKIKLICTAER